MIVRSNVISMADIGAAVRAAGSAVTFQDTYSREGWFVPVREFKPRRYERGFEFFLAGSSTYRAQHDREEFAATYDEWGIVIAELYKIDPDAEIAWYDNARDFITKTEKYQPRNAAAPWLADAVLYARAGC